jgi:hypothetical protein
MGIICNVSHHVLLDARSTFDGMLSELLSPDVVFIARNANTQCDPSIGGSHSVSLTTPSRRRSELSPPPVAVAASGIRTCTDPGCSRCKWQSEHAPTLVAVTASGGVYAFRRWLQRKQRDPAHASPTMDVRVVDTDASYEAIEKLYKRQGSDPTHKGTTTPSRIPSPHKTTVTATGS